MISPASGGRPAPTQAMAVIANNYQEKDFLTLESGDLGPRSKEYCSYIIEALETDKVFQIQRKRDQRHGYISNLPAGCCVEVPMYADRSGCIPSGSASCRHSWRPLNRERHCADARRGGGDQG